MATPRTIWPFDKIKTIDPFSGPAYNGFVSNPPACPAGQRAILMQPIEPVPGSGFPGLWRNAGGMRWICVANDASIPSGLPIPVPLTPASLLRVEQAARMADRQLRARGGYLGADVNDDERRLIMKWMNARAPQGAELDMIRTAGSAGHIDADNFVLPGMWCLLVDGQWRCIPN